MIVGIATVRVAKVCDPPPSNHRSVDCGAIKLLGNGAAGGPVIDPSSYQVGDPSLCRLSSHRACEPWSCGAVTLWSCHAVKLSSSHQNVEPSSRQAGLAWGAGEAMNCRAVKLATFEPSSLWAVNRRTIKPMNCLAPQLVSRPAVN